MYVRTPWQYCRIYLRPRFANAASSVITGMRGAKAGVSEPPLYVVQQTHHIIPHQSHISQKKNEIKHRPLLLPHLSFWWHRGVSVENVRPTSSLFVT